MKKITNATVAMLAGLFLLALTVPAFAADKERTITGEGKCAKCSMKEADKCQTVITVERKNGKKVNYYLVDNDVSKDFHKNICKEDKKVKATGTVKKGDDGKMELTATKIEVVN